MDQSNRKLLRLRIVYHKTTSWWAVQSQIDGSERDRKLLRVWKKKDEPMGSVISDRWIRERSKASSCMKKKRRADGQCNLRSMDQREIESFFVYEKKKDEPMGSVISDRWIRERSKASSFMKKKRRADGQCNLRSMDQREIESFFVYEKKKKKANEPMGSVISDRWIRESSKVLRLCEPMGCAISTRWIQRNIEGFCMPV